MTDITGAVKERRVELARARHDSFKSNGLTFYKIEGSNSESQER